MAEYLLVQVVGKLLAPLLHDANAEAFALAARLGHTRVVPEACVIPRDY